MTPPRPPDEPSISATRFAQELREGRDPRLEDYLGDAAGQNRSKGLFELIIEEVQYLAGKHLAGKSPPPLLRNYLARFPDDEGVVRAAFCKALADNPVEPLKWSGKYRDVRPLGNGAFGTVCQAVDELYRGVAIKVPKVADLDEPQNWMAYLNHSRDEARKAAKLSHAALASVYLFGDDPFPHVVMPFIEGESLNKVLKSRENFSWQQAVELVRQLGEALKHAHAKDLIHRDLKPANIILKPDNTPVIIDFGLAVLMGQQRVGELAGTPDYMSPEQLRGEKLDGRTDLWSLGVILYELLTGHRPFELSGRELTEQILHDQPTPPSQFPRPVPEHLESVCLKCLEKDRKYRYRSASAFLKDLDPRRLPPVTPPTSPISVQTSVAQGPAAPPSPLGATYVAAEPPAGPRNNLPQQLTSFIGRVDEMAEVKQLFATSRLLTLTGEGGGGKTRFALQLAADLLKEYGDGVWLVEFEALTDPGLVPQAVATALGVREGSGRSFTPALIDYLRPKSLLLVLDNCEHLLDACAQLVDTLLRPCPKVRILTTSREALRITGEQVWQVRRLSHPDPGRVRPATVELVSVFGQYDAIKLFLERAKAVRPDFPVTNASLMAVAQVCHRVDGMPLAIELAAARVNVLTAEQIAKELDDCCRVLIQGSRTAVPRHKSLDACIGWSYKRLSAPEQKLLRRVSVFAGGWTLEAAEVVCAGEEIDKQQLLGLLSRLVGTSLVVADTARPAEARYRLLETIRQYARRILIDTGKEGAVRARHRDYFLALAQKAVPELKRRRVQGSGWIG
jgi:non-specific serine/threonine protein kinase